MDRYEEHILSVLERSKEDAEDGICRLGVGEIDMIIEYIKEEPIYNGIVWKKDMNVAQS